MEIDVSKCYYYNGDNSPFCCELYDNECEAQNCYFQQLQQLKEHCKQVDETNIILYQEKCELIKENEELKKLKDEILNKKPSEREYCKNCILPAYSKVLDEIFEICDKELCKGEIKDLDMYAQIEMIIQKIKEVKEK